MKSESDLLFIFEKLPSDLQDIIIGLMDNESLSKFLQANKTINQRGKNLLISKKLMGLGFFNQNETLRENAIAFQKDNISEIIQALSCIFRKGNYDNEFKKLEKYTEHPLTQFLIFFILRERWHYQERIVLLKALKLAEISADEYNNLECCSLISSTYVRGLILHGAKEIISLVYKNKDIAKTYIIKIINSSLGMGKGEEYASKLGDGLFLLVGQGASQVIKIFTLEELEELHDEKLATLSFCANPQSLITFLNAGTKNRTELIRLINEEVLSSSSICLLATLLLSNPNYALIKYTININAISLEISKNDEGRKFTIQLKMNSLISKYQKLLNYHFSLAAELSEYKILDDSAFVRYNHTSKVINDSTISKFFSFDSIGRAITPPALATAVMSIGKKTIGEKFYQTFKDFSDRYYKLQNIVTQGQKDELNHIPIELSQLSVLLDSEISSEQKKSLKKQMFHHLTELFWLRLRTQNENKQSTLKSIQEKQLNDQVCSTQSALEFK